MRWTRCKRGHLRTEQNTRKYRWGKIEQWHCKVCESYRSRERRLTVAKINAIAKPKEAEVRAIIDAVADATGLSSYKILTGKKYAGNRYGTEAAAVVRQIAMYFARIHTGASFPTLGKVFGRDHSTAIFSHRKIQAVLLGRHVVENAKTAQMGNVWECAQTRALVLKVRDALERKEQAA